MKSSNSECFKRESNFNVPFFNTSKLSFVLER
jgi:hypothetical protein